MLSSPRLCSHHLGRRASAGPSGTARRRATRPTRCPARARHPDRRRAARFARGRRGGGRPDRVDRRPRRRLAAVCAPGGRARRSGGRLDAAFIEAAGRGRLGRAPRAPLARRPARLAVQRRDGARCRVVPRGAGGIRARACPGRATRAPGCREAASRAGWVPRRLPPDVAGMTNSSSRRRASWRGPNAGNMARRRRRAGRVAVPPPRPQSRKEGRHANPGSGR